MPRISSCQGKIQQDLLLIFEDMGYAKKIKFLFTCFYYICSILVIYKRYVILSKKGVGLSNQVYEIIKQRLITCEYKPNSVLNEAQLSTELG